MNAVHPRKGGNDKVIIPPHGCRDQRDSVNWELLGVALRRESSLILVLRRRFPAVAAICGPEPARH